MCGLPGSTAEQGLALLLSTVRTLATEPRLSSSGRTRNPARSLLRMAPRAKPETDGGAHG